MTMWGGLALIVSMALGYIALRTNASEDLKDTFLGVTFVALVVIFIVELASNG